MSTMCSLTAVVDTRYDTVVSLERLQRQLLFRLDSFFPHLLDLVCENDLGLGRRVDTVCLDGDQDTTADLQEQVCVQADDTSLIRLCDVGEDNINHTDQHAVAERVAGVFDDGDHVGAVGGHCDEITATAVGELDGVDTAGGSDDVGDMGDGGAAGSTQVEDRGAGADVDVLDRTC